MFPNKPARDYSTEHEALFPDAPREIAKLMGGRPFFFQVGATAIHRVGLFKGLGWKIPFGEAARNIDLIRVHVKPDSPNFRVEFGREVIRAEIPELDLIEQRDDVKPEALRSVYEEVTGGEA